MILISTRMKLSLFAASVMGIALVVVVNYTSVCRLQEVTLDDVPVADWNRRYAMLDADSGPGQSLDSLASRLLADTGVFKVDLSWSLPHRLEIKTNRFSPECFLVDKKSGRLFGVDDRARVVPLALPAGNWERPVLTGLTVDRVFASCADARVFEVVIQLQRLRRNHRDLYRLVEEIDFSDQCGLTVAVAGMPYHIKLRAETLPADMDRFARFITGFGVDLSDTRVLDLRFANMVVCGGEKN